MNRQIQLQHSIEATTPTLPILKTSWLLLPALVPSPLLSFGLLRSGRRPNLVQMLLSWCVSSLLFCQFSLSLTGPIKFDRIMMSSRGNKSSTSLSPHPLNSAEARGQRCRSTRLGGWTQIDTNRETEGNGACAIDGDVPIGGYILRYA